MAVIWWMRRDFRLSDNMALHKALSTGEPVIPVFVADPQILHVHNMGTNRVAFCFSAVEALDRRLRKAGAGYVVVRHGNPPQELAAVAREAGAGALYYNRDYSPLALRRDDAVERHLRAQGIDVSSSKDLVIWEEEEIASQSGQPYTVFSAYLRRWRLREPPAPVPPFYPEVPDLRTPDGLESRPLTGAKASEFPLLVPVADASEAAARERADEWFDITALLSVATYAARRDIPALVDGSSRLSAHIRFGTIGIRTLYALAMEAKTEAHDAEARRSIDLWVNQLAWRDFYYQVLYHFPHVMRGAFVKRYAGLRWRSDEQAFTAWREGRTGYPFVDAGMRQLAESGTMHNRLRMVTANFLVKDLMIDWRKGYDHFMRLLVDGDPASNNGGWQWASGTGASAQPHFRVFNPVIQGRKHDPEGAYIRAWLPELRDVDRRYIHEPWRMDAGEQAASGCIIGVDYPAPVVDHEVQKERVRRFYKRRG